MTIDLTGAGRAPFVFPSGCSAVSVPEISVISVCSLPELKMPRVSPKPVVFNIPQMPRVDIAPACIDIKVAPTIGIIPNRKWMQMHSWTKPTTPSFVLATKFSDCLEGRYRMRFHLRVNCPLDELPSMATGKVKFKDSEQSFFLRFHLAQSETCALTHPHPVSLRLDLPCVLKNMPSVVDASVQFHVSAGFKGGARIKINKGEDEEKCSIRPSLHIDLPCQRIITFSVPDDIVVERGNLQKSCTLKIGIKYPTCFNADITMLNGATVSSDGIWIRFYIMHYRCGRIVGVSGYNRPAAQAHAMKAIPAGAGVVEALEVADKMVRAPDYKKPGKWTKILGFTRCSGSGN